MPEPLTDAQVQAKAVEIVQTFANAPVTDPELFAARRVPHLMSLLVAVAQRGQHAVVYGRRGVGKTALVNMIAPSLGDQVKVVVHNCREEASLEPLLCDAATAAPKTVIVLDDVDRVRIGEAPKLLAKTIRALSSGDTTLVIVGAADSPDALVAESASFDGALVPLRLPPMTPAELGEIVERGLRRLSMTIDADAKKLIARLSCGQPRYTQLLALYAAHDAVLQGRSTHMVRSNVYVAARRVVDEAPPALAAAWREATHSKRENLFTQVLLACALTRKHELGWFQHDSVSQWLRALTGQRYHIRRFTRHLREFCETRGPILQRAGELYNYFYRFVNPSLESFIVMKATINGLWKPDRYLDE